MIGSLVASSSGAASQAELETNLGTPMTSTAELVAALVPYLQSTDLNSEGKLEAVAGVSLTSAAELAAAVAAHAGLPTAHHSNANDHSSANDPTADEKAALAGTSGAPAVGNKFVTNSDPRNSDARTPAAHAVSGHTGKVTLSQFVDSPFDARGGLLTWDADNSRWRTGHRDQLTGTRDAAALAAAGYTIVNAPDVNRSVTETAGGLICHISASNPRDWHHIFDDSPSLRRVLNWGVPIGRRIYCHISGITANSVNAGSLVVHDPNDDQKFCLVQFRYNAGQYEVYMGDTGTAVPSGVVSALGTDGCWVAVTLLDNGYWQGEYYKAAYGSEPTDADWTIINNVKNDRNWFAPSPISVGLTGVSGGGAPQPECNAVFRGLNIPQ